MRQNTGHAGYALKDDATVAFNGGVRPAPFARPLPAADEGVTISISGVVKAGVGERERYQFSPMQSASAGESGALLFL